MVPSPAGYSSPGLLSLPSLLAVGTGRDSGIMVVAVPVLALHQPSRDLHARSSFLLWSSVVSGKGESDHTKHAPRPLGKLTFLDLAH